MSGVYLFINVLVFLTFLLCDKRVKQGHHTPTRTADASGRQDVGMRENKVQMRRGTHIKDHPQKHTAAYNVCVRPKTHTTHCVSTRTHMNHMKSHTNEANKNIKIQIYFKRRDINSTANDIPLLAFIIACRHCHLSPRVSQ